MTESDIRYIQKALAGIEDLAVGASTVVQVRNGKSYTITKINASNLPYSGDVDDGDCELVGGWCGEGYGDGGSV